MGRTNTTNDNQGVQVAVARLWDLYDRRHPNVRPLAAEPAPVPVPVNQRRDPPNLRRAPCKRTGTARLKLVVDNTRSESVRDRGDE